MMHQRKVKRHVIQKLWDRQCEVCQNMTSSYDYDTGMTDAGCVVESDPEVEKAFELLHPCPRWKPNPPPCEFRRKGCEGES